MRQIRNDIHRMPPGFLRAQIIEGFFGLKTLAGFFVTVPLFITVAAIVWLFGVVDGLTTPLYVRLLGRHIPFDTDIAGLPPDFPRLLLGAEWEYGA